MGTMWMPEWDTSVVRREVPGRAGKAFTTGLGRKIVLTAHTGWSVPDWEEPPHFSLDLRPGKTSYQHVTLALAAYGLGRSQVETSPSNWDGGYVVTSVCILGLNESDGTWWSPEKYARLAYFLCQISNVTGAPTDKMPYMFNATAENVDRVRVDNFQSWQKTDGIVGICHDPDSDGRWGPGIIKHADLLKATQTERNKGASSGGSAVPGGNPGSVAEEGKPASTGDGTYELTDYDISSKPFRFNPPLHRGFQPKRVDFSSNDPSGFQSEVYMAETGLQHGGTDVAALQSMRLGRIIQHEWAAGMAAVNDFRYGFRFLYNPTSITTAASRNDSIYIDPQSSISAVVSGINQNFQTIRFQVYLNRIADVGEGNQLTKEDYATHIEDEDLEKIRVYGTHWDLEYLYRMCNGMFNMDDRGKSGDIGVIIPSNARLLLGPGENYFGFVESVSWTDQLFSGHMVPTLTMVDLVFRRHVDMKPEQMGDLMDSMLSSGVGVDEEGSRPGEGGSSDDSGGGDGSSDGGGSGGNSGDDSEGGPQGGGVHGDWPASNNCCQYGGGAGGPLSGEPNVYGTYHVAPAIRQLLLDLNTTFPNRDKGMDGTAGWGNNHVLSDSDHNPVGHVHGPKYGSARTVHALDFAIAGLPVDRIMNNLKKDPRVQYYIHKSTIYSRVRNFAPKGNSDHDKHIHVSLRSDTQKIAVEVENDTSRWVL